MTQSEHLWAIGYDDMERAEQVRDEFIRLGWGTHYLTLLDVAVVVRHPDGSFTCNHERFPAVPNLLGCTAVGFLVGLVLLAPLTGATVGALLGGAGTAAAVAAAGIGGGVVREEEGLRQRGTSALFGRAREGDMEVILHALQGLGGTVLKTNVDMNRAQLIQATLAAAAADTSKPENEP